MLPRAWICLGSELKFHRLFPTLCLHCIKGTSRISTPTMLFIPVNVCSLLRPAIFRYHNTKVLCPSARFASQRFLTTSCVLRTNNSSTTDSSEEIYVGPLSKQVRSVKVFSLSTSIMGMGMQPILAQQIGTGNTGILIAAASVVGFFTFVTPFLLHYITKSYVIRLAYDPKTDTYTSTTIRFFLTKKHLDFKADDVQIPDVPGPFTTFKVKDTPLFVDPAAFSQCDHYGRLMGFDKPIDLEVSEPETSVSEKLSKS